ncbi:presequence translocated-associated motor subunit PAM17 [Atractiella rhizophila]|nr:presequence translocated-associated motor subunit PAM17 [Atractiella rhizophila]
MSYRISQQTAIALKRAGVAKRTLATKSGRKSEGKEGQEAGPSTASSPLVEQSTLTWPEYFALRRSRHRHGIIWSIPTSLLGGAAGLSTFGSVESNPTEQVFGIDPLFVYGGGTIGCIALGYLLGPPLGTMLWRMRNKDALGQMDLKDKEFHTHLIKNRADPVRQSFSNPVPDYYGEKVHSIKGYRQWLRDQNAYRRKAQFGDDPL